MTRLALGWLPPPRDRAGRVGSWSPRRGSGGRPCHSSWISISTAPARRSSAAGLGKTPTTSVRRLISRLTRSSGLVDQIFLQCATREVGERGMSSRGVAQHGFDLGELAGRACRRSRPTGRAPSAASGWAKIGADRGGDHLREPLRDVAPAGSAGSAPGRLPLSTSLGQGRGLAGMATSRAAPGRRLVRMGWSGGGGEFGCAGVLVGVVGDVVGPAAP